MKLVMDLVYLLTAAVISPLVVYRMLRHNRYRAGWSHRFGNISRSNHEKRCIWIHAVSVGEINAIRTIVSQLRNRFPDFELVISTTTDTGFSRAEELFGDDLSVFYFPLDFSCVMNRAFDRIRPCLCLLTELEVWPNFVKIAASLSIPVVVVNGRISNRSFSRYKMVKALVEKMFGRLSLVLAQTDEYAERFRQLGVVDEKVVVTGSLKYDTAQIADSVEGAGALAAQLNIETEILWVAGGTGNNEEKILLAVYRKLRQDDQFGNVRLVIVPRKPERFDEVAQLIKQAGFALIRYSRIKDKAPASKTDSRTVILGDTMGDLRKFYSLATVVFTGRSLVPMGGSDMIESAALGKCTLFGPYTSNFTQTVEALLTGQGAIEVENEDQLLLSLQKCLSQPDLTRKIAQNGQHVIKKNQGATAKTIEEIRRFLETE